ncbi:fhuF 2Fe-2S C-terminal domain protein [Mycolicibacterium hassiacum DSM 44199]|jgi:hypothetical protein|uniref:FhuF 2Fe-2S C-terminal domain protein n=1 Tax=Mycolicibacterium hassiacum (strain DSM 44199 / CIP 105218 / JCM 12690 / 3849) TaxID=1122247 RepID=K5B7J2_MYCHD|nr:(2Fe-2S)-binding protein [Mycolicibacterium hassiacum]EKF22043.1 fhuF 2Fe-2S C-terminal domain protein [Mycolicibacterium hassiacum DSM 44199]MBX5486050.1 (2Fe-2S)-binding protein [Mycolicibacterium hassiacum]MDA4086965.1 iron reductase [Mycolicibacterium hassiacum DSM 44199]PZN21120.1 MAG: iron reductase [Mycolicibacterium hassiacum]VCT92069.1 hypothetical protein MHAS_03793 [Mycolicibacterium hassiacum DSM 44199]
MDISAELTEIGSYGEFFRITVGGSEAGWVPVGRCNADGWADLVEVTVARLGTSERRVAASMVQFAHAARLWSPVLACALVYRVVPDLASLQRARDGSALRLPTARAAPLEPTARSLYRLVVEQHLEPLADGLRVKPARSVRYGNAASALVESARALIAARPQLRDPAAELTASLLGTGKLCGAGDFDAAAWSFRRRSCCLYYRVPGGGKCGDCVLR